MKFRFLAFALFVLALTSAGAQQASTQYKNIGWKWTAAPNPNALPVCSTTVTKACITDQQLTLTDPTGAAQAPVSIPWGTNAYAYSPGGFLYCGAWNASVAVRYVDDQGAAKTDAPGTGSATVTCPFVGPGKPSGVAGTPGI